MIGIPYYLLDAFTPRPLAGNPAAVMPLDRWRSDSWHQAVAREMNQSETAFVVPRGPAWHLRWFTPETEVDLCGHATLATACVLWDEGLAAAGQPLEFATRSGPLRAVRTAAGIALDFPALPLAPCPLPPELPAALGIAPRSTWRSRLDLLAELESEEQVRRLAPDLTALARVPCRGLIVTAAAGSAGIDFVSRFFAPSEGIPEDPVTGSAHCALACFWSPRLEKTEFRARQLSQRGGELSVRLRGDRVDLVGQAVLVARGEFLADQAPA